MHYLSADQITKSFRSEPLFKGISFHINEGDKIALVARNGVGKSTLLKILAGQESPEEGSIWIHKDVRVAYFEQEPKFIEQASILENIFQLAHPVMDLIRAYESAVEKDNVQDLSDLLGKMDELQAWNFESKVRQILGKLNLHHLDQPLSALSGGQRKRVALAKVLIEIGFDHTHTLLMMDEPTNHLDVEMIEWLEYYLNQENVTLLLVSHDRYFLDAVCEEIWELEREKLFVYKGDYEHYLEKKALRMESEAASLDKARNEYRKELEWMRKQPKARTTKAKSRIDRFYDVEERAKQKLDDASMTLKVKMSRLGGKVVEMKKVYKSYGEKQILKGFDYTFSKGERIGIVGKNGTGKTTFLQILQGLEQADSGKINLGETVVFGNFSQKGLEVKNQIRVIEYVKSFSESFPLAGGGSLSAAQFLQLFLFSPEKQYTYVHSLSGGEKKRLQLLTVLFRNPNFLILDEPTNDLDLPTLAVLEKFLIDYTGCVLLVSHDRYFMDRIVDHLFIFEGEGNVRDFPGNYSQYRLWLKAEEEKKKQEEVVEVKVEEKIVAVQASGKSKKLSFKEKMEWETLEKDLPELEKLKAQLVIDMQQPNLSFEQMQQLADSLQKISVTLEEKEMRWLELSEKQEG